MIDVLIPSGSIVAVTEAQQTEQALTALVWLLLVVAALLAVLTIWYWRHTSPKRKMRRYAAHVQQVARPDGYDAAYQQSTYAEPRIIDADGPYRDAGQPYYR
ncbi:MAG: hypothetical protein ACR2QO_05135 [Acidimicrobiales bacterium]